MKLNLCLIACVVVCLLAAGCPGSKKETIPPNQYGGETKEIMPKPGDPDYQPGVLRTIYYYDAQGRKREQVDFFSKEHPLYQSGGTAKAVAYFDEEGRVREILTYNEKGSSSKVSYRSPEVRRETRP
ncbi:MAG: hypothetical protein AB1896_11110 [Thermodesulfobacteriota bacterium]